MALYDSLWYDRNRQNTRCTHPSTEPYHQHNCPEKRAKISIPVFPCLPAWKMDIVLYPLFPFYLLPDPLRSIAKADRCRQPVNPRPAPVALRPGLGVDRLAHRIGHVHLRLRSGGHSTKGEMTMTDNPTLTKADLAQFTGTDIRYSYRYDPSMHYTEGVKYVADMASAHWIIAEISLGQIFSFVQPVKFQHWTLTVDSDRNTNLICTDQNGVVVTMARPAETNFPLDEISFFFTNNVLCLPSEYRHISKFWPATPT